MIEDIPQLPLAGDGGSMYRDRWCEGCRQVCQSGEPDPCIGLIPGVSQACCGHGREQPYVVIGGEPNQSISSHEHHVTLRGVFATLFFSLVREARKTGWFEGPQDIISPAALDEYQRVYAE